MKPNMIKERGCKKCFGGYDHCGCPEAKELWLGLCDCVCLDEGVHFPGVSGFDESLKWDELGPEQKEVIENFVGINHFLDNKLPLIDSSSFTGGEIVLTLKDTMFIKELTVIAVEGKVLGHWTTVNLELMRKEFVDGLWQSLVDRGKVEADENL